MYDVWEIRALISRGLATVSPAAIAARIRDVINVVDVTRELVSCPVPILYIQAIRDYIVPASNLAKIQALKPNIEVARVEAPHTILQTQPLRSAQLIAEFANAHATI